MVIPKVHRAKRETASATRGSIDMKMVPALSFLFIAVSFATAAWSQCATGVGTGGQCIPPDALPGADQDQQAQPAESQAVWATRWGAVAYDSVSGAEGHITAQTSKSRAKNMVLSLCAQHGGKNCKILVSYYNQCVALAQVPGGGDLGYAREVNSEKAKQIAIKQCGHDTCRVVYSACSLPVRVQ